MIFHQAIDQRYVLTDQQGSVVALAHGSNGSVFAHNSYGPYGEPAAGNWGRYQHSGQQWYGRAGLSYMRNRWYHPELGRFMSADPIGYQGGMNLYAYTSNDPLNRWDPWGLCGADICVMAERRPPVLFTEQIQIHNWFNRIRHTFEDIGFLYPEIVVGAPRGSGGPGWFAGLGRLPSENNPCNALLPDGSTVNENAEFMRHLVEQTQQDAAEAGIYNPRSAHVSVIGVWIGLVSPRGFWDYKRQRGGTDTQGNLNYGATGIALGFSEQLLLRAAGAVQTANPENQGNWWDLDPSSSYGDQPRDQNAIRQGIRCVTQSG